MGRIRNISIGVLFLIFGLLGIQRMSYRSSLPFAVQRTGDHLRIGQISPRAGQSEPAEGDVIRKINDLSVHRVQDLELAILKRKSGESVTIAVQRGESVLHFTVQLLQKYDKRVMLINLLVGSMFWIVGFFVYIKKPGEISARILFWTFMVVSESIMLYWEGSPYHSGDWGYIFPFLNFIAWPLVPGFILYFCLLYPYEKQYVRQYVRPIIVVFSISFILLFESTYLAAVHLESMPAYHAFWNIYTVFRIYLLICLLVAIVCFIHSFRVSKIHANRNKIQWILLGIFIGTFPFFYLWTLPILIGLPPLVPEFVNYIALMVIPVAFGFSIIKYQALNIDIVINRSLVYGIISGIILITYLIIVGLAGHLFNVHNPGKSPSLMILFTLSAALAFSPLKSRVQTFVDKTFYRIKYNYRIAVNEFCRLLASVHEPDQLTALIIDKINKAIPISKMAIMYRHDEKDTFQMIGHQGLTKKLRQKIEADFNHYFISRINSQAIPLTKRDLAETGHVQQYPVDSEMADLGMEFLIPIIVQNQLTGALILGEKLSGSRFVEEDLELISTMAREGYMTRERLKLQEHILLEKAEKQKLEELSRLKSEFISHISHELRTPLTSIRWSVENLLDGIPEKPGPKTKEYLGAIYDNTTHLDRMIANLLDITKIEAGKLEVNAERLLLSDVLLKAVNQLQPIAHQKDITLKVKIPKKYTIRADHDWLQAVLINLLDNAIKYSESGKEVQIGAIRRIKLQKDKTSESTEKMAVISIKDQGIGIPEDKQKVIFDQFERVRTDRVSREKGLGLGLHIVKKLILLQGGEIWVESRVGKGSTFSFSLPLI